MSRVAPTRVDPPDPAAAELLLHGGQIFTGEGLATVEAVAIRGGLIVAAGDDAKVLELLGPETRSVDLGGRAVLTALTDAHAHLYGLGLQLARVELRGCESADACAQRIAAAARDMPAGGWLQGRGWDQNLFADRQFPHRGVLDSVAGPRPVWVRRVDGHAGWANSRALALAGIARHTPDPAGGLIVRDAAGEPTGILIDTAMDLVGAAVPLPDLEERAQAILRGQELALRRGLTSVHEMGIDEQTAEVYAQLEREGRLEIRVHAFADDALATLEALMARRAPARTAAGSLFALAGVKLYSDGALGSRGAALLAPYDDEPANLGLTLVTPEVLTRVARQALDRGWQMAVHAIGDRANREVLQAYAAAGCGAAGDHRFRVEHAQILSLDDLGHFQKLGVIASMQPTHATSDMPWAEARLGSARLAGAYAWRRLLEAGARLALGSDFPVETVEPFSGGMYAALSRQDRQGQPPGGWQPDQRLDLGEALHGFTAGAAYAAFEERWRGRAIPGQAADFTVLDRPVLGRDSSGQPTTPPPSLWQDIQVDLTIVAGRIGYRRH